MATAPSPPDTAGGLVAHLVIVGFHAKLGNRIEFAYPRLVGDGVLRPAETTDSLDISADPFSPSSSVRPYVTGLTPPAAAGDSPFSAETPSPSAGGRRGDWGTLPDEWRFLPFMALPDGAHDTSSDVVFFSLGPSVHCVACFRQAEAKGASSLSATRGRGYADGVAARGSVQKSVVLLCRAPLYGALAGALAPAVEAYFDQADFANTNGLAALFHALNRRHSPRSGLPAADPHRGLLLREVVRALGAHALAVLKLVLLERRVVLYATPASAASNAVVALASVFPGAIDAHSDEDGLHGLPLELFGPRDRVVLQPYAPLPHMAELLRTPAGQAPAGCLVGTSHSVGMLLSSAASAAARGRSKEVPSTEILDPRNVAAAFLSPGKPERPRRPRVTPPAPLQEQTPPGVRRGGDWADNATGAPEAPPRPPSLTRSSSAPSTPASASRLPPAPPLAPESPPADSGGGRLPVVDALVNLSTGKVSVAGSLEPIVRCTRAERLLVRDLLAVSANLSGDEADAHVRSRLRLYLRSFLSSVATLPGVVGGPPLVSARGFDPCWSSTEASSFHTKPVSGYNEKFVRAWLRTHNAAVWGRRVSPGAARLRPPPPPEMLVHSSSDEGAPAFLSPVEDLVAGLGGISSLVSQGISSFFRGTTAEGAEASVTPPVPVATASGNGANGAGGRQRSARKAPPTRPHPPQARLRYGVEGSPNAQGRE